MWKCGVPQAYARGNCKVQVLQHHRDPTINTSSFETTVFDNNMEPITSSSKFSYFPNDTRSDQVTHPIEVDVGDGLIDPVKFAYNGSEWDSNSPNCTIGKATSRGESKLESHLLSLIISQVMRWYMNTDM
jgi:hypothetical protein